MNAVACFDTDESCEELYSILHSFEESYHKAPPYRFGPRTLDLDLLLFDDRIVPSRSVWQNAGQLFDPTDFRLFVPHLRLHCRRFVLAPLVELIGPTALHPVFLRTYSSFLSEVSDQECTMTPLVL